MKRLMRLSEVTSNTGLSRPTIYKRMAMGVFPKPVPIGERAVAWVSDEIEAWILERIEDRDRLFRELSELAG